MNEPTPKSAQELFDQMVKRGDLDITDTDTDTEGDDEFETNNELEDGDEPAPSNLGDFEDDSDPTIDEDVAGMDPESFEARVREIKDEAPLDPDLMAEGEYEAYRSRLDTEGETFRDMLRSFREEDRARRAKAAALKELAQAEAPSDPDQTLIDEVEDLDSDALLAFAEAIKSGDEAAQRRIARKAGAASIRGLI